MLLLAEVMGTQDLEGFLRRLAAVLDRTPWWVVAALGLVAVVALAGAASLAVDRSAERPGPLDASVAVPTSGPAPAVSATPPPAPPRPLRPPRLLEAAPAATTGPSPSPPPPAPASALIGFYVNWDAASLGSLKAHLSGLTALMPMWYHLGNDGHLRQNDPAKQAEVTALVRTLRPGLPVIPIVNYQDATRTDVKELAHMLADAGERERITDEIVSTMKAGGFAGVNIDFEMLPPESKEPLVAFMTVLAAKAHAAGLEVSQDFTFAGAAYDIARLGAVNDYMIPMMYDEHWKSSPAGPIASQGWYERGLRKVFAQVPPAKVIVALGLWTYDWASGQPAAKAYKHPEAVAEAARTGATITFDPVALNPTFTFAEDGVTHRYWMLDAATLFNQVRTASAFRPRGYALWRLGQEDPAIWPVLADRDDLGEKTAKALEADGRSIEYDRARGLIIAERLQR